MTWSGGCQCGAVRFSVEGKLGRASICHCRMCQKAFGAPFGALVSVEKSRLTWRREPSRFASSNKVQRGFCPACGTPLTFEWNETVIDLALCAFDRADEIVPVVQMATGHRLSWLDGLDLPERPPEEAAEARRWADSIVSHQHPDHD